MCSTAEGRPFLPLLLLCPEVQQTLRVAQCCLPQPAEGHGIKLHNFNINEVTKPIIL